MKTLSALLLGMACLVSGGPSRSALADPAGSPAAAPATPSWITSIQTRRHVLRVFAGPAGHPRFAVEDRSGRVLAKDLDLQLLAKRWPGLHKTWQVGQAQVWAGR